MPDAGVPPLVDLRIDRKAYTAGMAARDGAAVLGLSLTIGRGEIVALVGPSGCGKTTTLRILVGLDRAYEGRVVPDPADLAIRVMFQEPRLLPWRSVEDNVRLVLPPHRRGTDLVNLFSELGIEAFLAHFPGQLSLGLARRVALARALADPPALLVLDEPLVSLDEAAAVALRQIVLGRAARDGMAVVLVTHNLREAIAMADRLVLLSPRPARVLREIALDRAREDRPDDWIEARRQGLVEWFAADAG